MAFEIWWHNGVHSKPEAWLLTGMPEDPAPLRPAPIDEAGWKFTDGDGKDLELEDCWLAGYIFTMALATPRLFAVDGGQAGQP